MNVEAEWQSRNSRDPSEWKLFPKVFQQVFQRRGMPKIDLLASRVSHQLPQCFAWKPDPFSQGTDALQQIWRQSIPLCVSPILPHSTSLEASELRPNRKTVACHTNLAVSNLVPPSARNVYSSSTPTSNEHKLNKLTRGISPSNCKQDITTSGVDHIRERLLKKGVSETAAQLITSTRQKSSQLNYNSF